MTPLLRKIHRWAGLLLASFIIFYCVTGLLLNHRQVFDYFLDKDQTVSRVEKTDMEAIESVIAMYKKQIKRSDDPTVIRIKKDKTIEFLYGSHGKTTYVIHPATGVMEKIEKHPQEPLNRLNNLHKALKTGPFWVVLADTGTMAILLITLTGLFILRYRPVDYLLVVGGVLLLVAGMVLA